jgi:hypothetical protein
MDKHFPVKIRKVYISHKTKSGTIGCKMAESGEQQNIIRVATVIVDNLKRRDDWQIKDGGNK